MSVPLPGIACEADPTLYSLRGIWRRRGARGVARFVLGGARRALRKLRSALLPGLATRLRRRHFRRLFAALDRHEVRYLTIGSAGMALNGLARATPDIDLLVEDTPDNAVRALAAMRACGFVQARYVTVDDVLRNRVTYFSEHIQVDLLRATRGISFPDAWERRRICRWDGVAAIAASPLDIIANKNAYRRLKDQNDIEQLLTLGLGL